MPSGNHICVGHLFTFAAQQSDASHPTLPTSGEVQSLLEKNQEAGESITKRNYRDLAVKTK